MNNPHLQRAEILLSQNRFDLAEGEARQAIAAEPNEPLAYSYLALCLSEQEQWQPATEAAQRAISLDPAIEQEISDSIAQTADGEYLAMEPTRAHALVSSLATQAEHAVARGGRPVVICSSRVRRHLRRLVEQNLPQLSICAYNEIAPGISVETIGVVSA